MVAPLDGKARVEPSAKSEFLHRAGRRLDEVQDFSFTTRLDIGADTIKSPAAELLGRRRAGGRTHVPAFKNSRRDFGEIARHWAKLRCVHVQRKPPW